MKNFFDSHFLTFYYLDQYVTQMDDNEGKIKA